MAETKHTPGPWTWSAATKDSNFGGFGAWVTGPDTRICKARGGVKDEREVAEANARLIAAAPEMLAALKVVTLDLNIHAWFAAHDPKALEQVDAAIAKAEGQS